MLLQDEKWLRKTKAAFSIFTHRHHVAKRKHMNECTEEAPRHQHTLWPSGRETYPKCPLPFPEQPEGTVVVASLLLKDWSATAWGNPVVTPGCGNNPHRELQAGKGQENPRPQQAPNQNAELQKIHLQPTGYRVGGPCHMLNVCHNLRDGLQVVPLAREQATARSNWT